MTAGRQEVRGRRKLLKVVPLVLTFGLLPFGTSYCTSSGQLQRSAVVTPDRAAQRRAVLADRVLWLADTIPIVRFEPPFIYGSWRLELESCSGLRRKDWPKFYLSPVSPLPPRGSLAFYIAELDAIVFALGTENNASIVRHEMLHFLLEPRIPPKPDGETQEEFERRLHPTEYFGGASRCTGIITRE